MWSERVFQGAEFFDSTFDGVGRLQEFAGSHRDACGGAGGYDVAGFECHDVAEERDDIGDGVNHLRCVGFLADAAVYGKLHIEILHIVHIVFCEQVRSHRQEAVGPFAVEPVVKLVPGSPDPCFSEGDTSCGDVVDDSVTGHCIEDVLGLYTLGWFADYNGQFDFIIHLFTVGGPGDLLIRADDDGRGHYKGPRYGRFAR